MLAHFLYARRTDLISFRFRRTKIFSHNFVGMLNSLSPLALIVARSFEGLAIAIASSEAQLCSSEVEMILR
jgi:hypothetical protein